MSMAVYVDDARNHFGRMIMCHMVADTTGELHDMAEKVGMKRSWYQSVARYPHYDVSLFRRKIVVAEGAIEVTTRELIEIQKKVRQKRLHGVEYV